MVDAKRWPTAQGEKVQNTEPMTSEGNPTVSVLFVEPWDLVSSNPNPFPATVLATDGEHWLVDLAKVFTYRGREYRYLVLILRVEPKSSRAVKSCNFIGVPPEKLNLKCPFDTSWFRGGCAGISAVVDSERVGHPPRHARAKGPS